jgi:hypothetical protein
MSPSRSDLDLGFARFRRFSPNFVKAERDKLYAYRNDVRRLQQGKVPLLQSPYAAKSVALL